MPPIKETSAGTNSKYEVLASSFSRAFSGYGTPSILFIFLELQRRASVRDPRRQNWIVCSADTESGECVKYAANINENKAK